MSQIEKAAPQPRLPAGAIAIAGRSGSGKSTLFHGCRLVDTMIVADSGSRGHFVHFKGAGGVKTIDTSPSAPNPIDQVKAIADDCAKRGAIFALDSFSTLCELLCLWYKGKGNGQIPLKTYGEIVMSLRDFALYLGARECFVLFNTSPGGKTKNPMTNEIEEIPTGCITGLGSLAGLKGKEETILRAFSTVWVLVAPIDEVKDAEGKTKRKAIPRGFILPGRDFRGVQRLSDGKIVKPSDYTPIKDALFLLQPESEDDAVSPVLPVGKGCTIDAILTRIAGMTSAK